MEIERKQLIDSVNTTQLYKQLYASKMFSLPKNNVHTNIMYKYHHRAAHNHVCVHALYTTTLLYKV